MTTYHYVYRITNKKLKKHYYGCRSSKSKPIFDLGIKYFSSSNDKQFIAEQHDNPKYFRYKILKIFETRKEALAFEMKLHNKLMVDKNPSFYNKARQTSDGFYFSNKGSKFSKEHCEKISIKSRNKSEETRNLISEKVKLNWANMSDDRRKQRAKAISKSLSGKPQPIWKNKKHSERMTGSGNSKAKIIHIYDNNNNLKYKCNGNLKKICTENNLPYTSLRKSHINGGEPLFNSKRSKNEAEKRGWLRFQNWYAIEIKK